MDENGVGDSRGPGVADYDDEFAGKKVLITGASGVIGGWIADAFAKRGASLILSDSRVQSLKLGVSNGRWAGANVIANETELRDPKSLEGLASLVETEWGAPDVVVNNAGIYPHKPLLDVGLDEWQMILDVNLTAPFVLISRMAKMMIRDGVAGSIVNILSSASVSVSSGGVSYSVSKAALAMLTRGAALELAPHHIRVNGVSPGFAPGSEVSPLEDDYVESMVRSIPLGRPSGPKDSPEAVVFLCSSRASFITGTVISVDGGRTAGPVSR